MTKKEIILAIILAILLIVSCYIEGMWLVESIVNSGGMGK